MVPPVPDVDVFVTGGIVGVLVVLGIVPVEVLPVVVVVVVVVLSEELSLTHSHVELLRVMPAGHAVFIFCWHSALRETVSADVALQY